MRRFNPRGQFTIVQSPYNPQTLNRYSYCNNNPINLVDPTGHGWFKKWFGKIFGAIAGIVTTLFTGNMMAGFQMFNLFNSLGSAVNSGNWGGFTGGMIGGMLGGWAGGGLAGRLSGMLGESSFSFGGGFAIGATEMGMAGFGAGVGGALGEGGSFSDAMKAGGIGFASGAVIGGLVEGTYAAGWQKIAHGADRETLGKNAKVERQLSLEVVKKPIPIAKEFVGGYGGYHWGLRIKDNYNEFNGVWDFDYIHNPFNFGKVVSRKICDNDTVIGVGVVLKASLG